MIDEIARVDVHSHLVPGVDDGARTLEDSLESIERMMRMGVRAIVTTPHFDASLMAGPAGVARIEEVEAAFAELHAAVAERFPEVWLARGFEIKMDEPNPDLSDPRLRLAGTDFVLIEWPSMQVPPGTSGAVRRLISKGLYPIVAHPERYRAPEAMVPLARMWKEAGAFLQVNLGSLVGQYGSRAERRAWQLLEAGVADYLASDHHGRPHIELQLDRVVARLEELGAEEQVKMLVRSNPRRIVDGLEPLPVRPVPKDTGWRAKLKKLFQTEAT